MTTHPEYIVESSRDRFLYYNPEVGRFISSDVLLSTGQGVIGHNAYAYYLNNPVNMIDYSGHLNEVGFLNMLAVAKRINGSF